MTAVETGLRGGVSFALSEEQRELRRLAREFAEKRSGPKRPGTTSTRPTRPTSSPRRTRWV